MDIVKYNGTELERPKQVKTMRVIVGEVEYKIKDNGGCLMVTTAKNEQLSLQPLSINAFKIKLMEEDDD